MRDGNGRCEAGDGEYYYYYLGLKKRMSEHYLSYSLREMGLDALKFGTCTVLHQSPAKPLPLFCCYLFPTDITAVSYLIVHNAF